MFAALHPLRTVAMALAAALVLALSLAAEADAARGGKGKPRPPADTTISFAGYDWNVKSSSSRLGPGPNYFDARNVAVDESGDLHLKVQKRRGKWTTAEVILSRPLGYGTYSFEVASALDGLDPNVVLGLFTWSDDPAQNHREIDVEFSRFGDPSSPVNAHYVVQPYWVAGNVHRWTIGAEVPTRHQFRWTPGQVEFTSLSSGFQLQTWTLAGPDVPEAGDAAARMNFWLLGGNAPMDGRADEVVVSDFSFTPA
jgi:hypothetical protein